MPQMFGVPTSGQPFATPYIAPSPAQQLIERQAEHKMEMATEIKHDGKIPMNEPGLEQQNMPPIDRETELEEAIKQHGEALKLSEMAKSPKDKETANRLVKFWEERIDVLRKEVEGGIIEPKPEATEQPVQLSQQVAPPVVSFPPKIVRTVEAPELHSRIRESAVRRVRNPRNPRHKKEKKPAKKVTWLIDW